MLALSSQVLGRARQTPLCLTSCLFRCPLSSWRVRSDRLWAFRGGGAASLGGLSRRTPPTIVRTIGVLGRPAQAPALPSRGLPYQGSGRKRSTPPARCELGGLGLSFPIRNRWPTQPGRLSSAPGARAEIISGYQVRCFRVAPFQPERLEGVRRAYGQSCLQGPPLARGASKSAQGARASTCTEGAGGTRGVQPYRPYQPPPALWELCGVRRAHGRAHQHPRVMLAVRWAHGQGTRREKDQAGPGTVMGFRFCSGAPLWPSVVNRASCAEGVCPARP